MAKRSPGSRYAASAFLGLTVTITHTAGVFALGLVTLFASQYVVAERLFPILSFVSGGIVATIGFSLFVRRLRTARRKARVRGTMNMIVNTRTHADRVQEHMTTSPRSCTRAFAPNHVHGHPHEHSHGGRSHSHLPPGADGTPVTWRNLLALGISADCCLAPQHSWFCFRRSRCTALIRSACCRFQHRVGSNAYRYRTSVRLYGSFVQIRD